MSKTLKVKIITLNNVIVEENIAKIFIKSNDGKLEVMAGHAPMITSIVPNITILEDLGFTNSQAKKIIKKTPSIIGY